MVETTDGKWLAHDGFVRGNWNWMAYRRTINRRRGEAQRGG